MSVLDWYLIFSRVWRTLELTVAGGVVVNRSELLITCVLKLVSYACCGFVFFFFQAEDGIRYSSVTGVQTCALPIWLGQHDLDVWRQFGPYVQTVLVQRIPRMDLSQCDPLRPVLLKVLGVALRADVREIGRASCRERV